jgi:SPX domain
MKFGKIMRRLVETSDPEWAPYCTNYKFLKECVKGLRTSSVQAGAKGTPPDSYTIIQGHAGETTSSERMHPSRQQSLPANRGNSRCDVLNPNDTPRKNDQRVSTSDMVKTMAKLPGEVAFFKLLLAECNKICHFFGRMQEEFILREQRVQEDMAVIEENAANMPIMSTQEVVTEQTRSLVLRSLYHLYKDLMQFETYAIMMYCSFSKILKKHDRVTGYNTRIPFMTKVVNKANFASYPVVLEMIQRCEKSYKKHILRNAGNEEPLEDVHLFIGMIRRMNSSDQKSPDKIQKKP